MSVRSPDIAIQLEHPHVWTQRTPYSAQLNMGPSNLSYYRAHQPKRTERRTWCSYNRRSSIIGKQLADRRAQCSITYIRTISGGIGDWSAMGMPRGTARLKDSRRYNTEETKRPRMANLPGGPGVGIYTRSFIFTWSGIM